MTRRTLLQLPLAAAAARAETSWLADTYRMLHVDAHFARQPNPYADFNADRAAATIHDAGFQMVSIFAVCNRGLSYYPTKIGTVHPGLKRDFTGEFSKALKKCGVRVIAYVSARDCQPDVAQLKEIVELYGVDGFFFDAVLRCPGDEAATRFIDTVSRELKPGLAYFMNHLWVTLNHPVNPPKSLKTLVWEPVPPYTGVIADDFSIQARYLPTVPGIENWSCMTTRGMGWGDRSIRDLDSYLLEAAIVLAAGGRPYWGDISAPSGNPDPALYELWRKVNARTASLEPYIRDVKPVKEVAVLVGKDSPNLASVHRRLVEAHVQFSIVNGRNADGYKLLVAPDSDADLPPEKRQIRVENAPFNVEMTLNRRQNDYFLHLVNSGNAVTGIRVRLRPSTPPKRVLLVPERRSIPFAFRDGELSFEALPLHIHSAYQIEG